MGNLEQLLLDVKESLDREIGGLSRRCIKASLN